jgi:hypothetical protein
LLCSSRAGAPPGCRAARDLLLTAPDGSLTRASSRLLALQAAHYIVERFGALPDEDEDGERTAVQVRAEEEAEGGALGGRGRAGQGGGSWVGRRGHGTAQCWARGHGLARVTARRARPPAVLTAAQLTPPHPVPPFLARAAGPHGPAAAQRRRRHAHGHGRRPRGGAREGAGPAGAGVPFRAAPPALLASSSPAAPRMHSHCLAPLIAARCSLPRPRLLGSSWQCTFGFWSRACSRSRAPLPLPPQALERLAEVQRELAEGQRNLMNGQKQLAEQQSKLVQLMHEQPPAAP